MSGPLCTRQVLQRPKIYHTNGEMLRLQMDAFMSTSWGTLCCGTPHMARAALEDTKRLCERLPQCRPSCMLNTLFPERMLSSHLCMRDRADVLNI